MSMRRDLVVQGVFVRTWCPELARLPNEYIHTPWLAPAQVLREAGVELGVNYPRPLLTVTQWNQQVNIVLFDRSIDSACRYALGSESTTIGAKPAEYAAARHQLLLQEPVETIVEFVDGVSVGSLSF